MSNSYDICIMGGCGHVGAPLGILFASQGFKVVGYDVNEHAVAALNQGSMLFYEPGCVDLLKQALLKKSIFFTIDPAVIKDAKFLIVCVGTPVDEYGNPKFSIIDDLVVLLNQYMNLHDQVLILRSSVYPGTTEYIKRKLKGHVKIAFCPERIAEGFALKEYAELPQIVASPDLEVRRVVRELFSSINNDIYEMDNFKEAELVKIFTNVYRYINFAIANQFFMIAERDGLNFDRIVQATTYRYPRTQGLVNKGFVGGSCLHKDTLQLNAFHNNYFTLGQSAVSINEGLPDFIVDVLEKRFGNLKDKIVGILGMTYKADIDDVRSALSFKLKKILNFKSAAVVWHDPYFDGKAGCAPLEEVLRSDIVVLAVPHRYYRERWSEIQTKSKNFYNATYV